MDTTPQPDKTLPLIAGPRHALYQGLAEQHRYTLSRRTRHTLRLLPHPLTPIYFDPLRYADMSPAQFIAGGTGRGTLVERYQNELLLPQRGRKMST